MPRNSRAALHLSLVLSLTWTVPVSTAKERIDEEAAPTGHPSLGRQDAHDTAAIAGPGEVVIAVERLCRCLWDGKSVEEFQSSPALERAQGFIQSRGLLIAIESGADSYLGLSTVRDWGSAAVLRAVRRGSIMPPSEGLARQIDRELCGDLGIDRELLRLISLSPSEIAAPILRKRADDVESGQIDGELLGAIAWSLARVGDAKDLTRLKNWLGSHANTVWAVQDAWSTLVQRLKDQELNRELIEALETLHEAHRDEPELGLTAASTAMGIDNARARDRLTSLWREGRESPQSLMRNASLEAALGLGVLQWLEGNPPDSWLLPVIEELAGTPDNHTQRRSIGARALFILGAFAFDQGDKTRARETFALGVRAAPYESTSNQLYGVLWGRFGLFSLLQRHRVMQGKAADSLAQVELLIDVLNRDSKLGYFGVSGKLLSDEDSERPISWTPLYRAHILTQYLDSHDSVTRQLSPFARELEPANLFDNLLLAIQARRWLAIAFSNAERYRRSLVEWNRAIKGAIEWQRETLRSIVTQITQKEREYGVRQPAPRHGVLENPAARTGDDWVASFYLGASSVEGTWLRDLEAASQSLLAAKKLSPHDPDVRLSLALREAHEGRPMRALRLLEVIDEAPFRHYNMGCVHAIIGDSNQALEYLTRAIDEWMPTKESKRQWRRSARQDPDLASLIGNPRFEVLTRDD